ncbi:hypothetical protein [Methylobacterium symbioticum]|uniref:Uncharacterized protein n=1 Tax=Methylobacterium symbioticum TaxID=2584084 RepID=A0A509EHN0_9HYPH|nr:hypothetical protein [Methylobacterium symbioticum]VUD72693.1 hypothetical protein MET9862_03293 [Methylobacterium symbioticum]
MPSPAAAASVVRPPGPQAARKVRELTELLIEHFQSAPELWGLDAAVRGPSV